VNRYASSYKLLAISRLVQETIFWYSIFVAFAYSIDLSLQEISYSIIAVNLGVILFEVPSGVLADRWSRKWTLFIGTLTLIAASLIIGLSTGPLQYIIGSFIWGIFFALQSGSPESLIYDMLKVEKSTKLYKKYLARFTLMGTAGLMLGSFSGAFIADTVSLKAAYLLTIIPSVISLALLYFVKEPKQHQESQEFNAYRHYGIAISQLAKKGQVGVVVIALVMVTAGVSFLFELNQVYYFAAGLPLALYGIVNSTLQFAIGGGSWLADKVSTGKAILAAGIAFLALSVFILFSVTVFSTVLLSVMLLLLFYLTASMSHYLQDQISSEVRAAANSMVSTGGRLVFSVLIILFGVINSSKEEVNGYVLLTIVAIVIFVLLLLSSKGLNSFDKSQRD